MKFDPEPDIAHGQAIFWHEGEGCVQGVTELVECVRTDDPWLLEVQQQMRQGNHSQDSWCFLHGHKTIVPGNWVKGAPACGNDKCLQTWSANGIDCDQCQVMYDPNDHRKKEDQFITAPAIFPNNDIQFEVNKIR